MFTSYSACDIESDRRIVLSNHVAAIRHVFGDIEKKLLVSVSAALDTADLSLDREFLAVTSRLSSVQTTRVFH